MKVPSEVTVKAAPPPQVILISPWVKLLLLRVIVVGEFVSVKQSPTATGEPFGPFTVVDGTV